MATRFDALVYVGIGFLFVIFIGSCVLIALAKKEVDLETRKLRFAAVMFTGFISLFIFAALIYIGASPEAGVETAAKDIFEKAVTGMTPLAGVVLGYFFGVRQRTEQGGANEVPVGQQTK